MNIYFLYTGGTIGSWETKEGLAPMPWKIFKSAFQKKIEQIITKKHPDINFVYDGFDAPLDSTNMQPRQWVEIAQRIIDNYLNCDGFLILHGTDTMAYTSSALSFLLPKITKPIIVTGSQLPLFKTTETKRTSVTKFDFQYNTDALRNIMGSISFLTQGMPEVCLFFADKLFRGNRAVKSNANGFIAFESPNFPPLGEYGLTPKLNKNLILPIPRGRTLDFKRVMVDGKIRSKASWKKGTEFLVNLPRLKKKLERIVTNINEKSVIPFLIFPAYHDESSDQSLLVNMLNVLIEINPNVKGIILNSYGAGNVPDFKSMKDFIEIAYKRGIIIVDCTQVFSGTVNKNTYATGSWMKDRVISANDMTPIAALSKLAIQLTQYSYLSKAEIENKFGEVIAGEMTNNYSLSGHQNEFLMPGDRLTSINGKYQFENTLQGDLVLWDMSDGIAKQVSIKKCGSPGRVIMQSYFGLVFYDKNLELLYSSHDGDLDKDAFFMIENNGDLTIRDSVTNHVIKEINDDFELVS